MFISGPIGLGSFPKLASRRKPLHFRASENNKNEFSVDKDVCLSKRSTSGLWCVRRHWTTPDKTKLKRKLIRKIQKSHEIVYDIFAIY